MLCCVHWHSSHGNVCFPQQGARWKTPPVLHCSHPSTVGLDCALYYRRYTVHHINTYNITRVGNIPAKVDVSASWNYHSHQRRTFSCPNEHAGFLDPLPVKRHSQLSRIQSIKSNLLTSSIACLSEQGGHLCKKRKWLHAHNQPDGDIRFHCVHTHYQHVHSLWRHNISLMMSCCESIKKP